MLSVIPEDRSKDAWIAATWKQEWEASGPTRIRRYVSDPGEGAAPDLGLGRLGSCPGASTKKGLHKSTHFFNMAESYSVCHRGLLVNVCKFHFNYAFYTPLLRPFLRQCISHEWNVQWPSSQGSSKEQPGGLDTLCRALAKPSC